MVIDTNDIKGTAKQISEKVKVEYNDKAKSVVDSKVKPFLSKAMKKGAELLSKGADKGAELLNKGAEKVVEIKETETVDQENAEIEQENQNSEVIEE